MSWLDEAYPFRVAVTVDGSADTFGSFDVSAIISEEWDFFWTLIDTDGFGIRVALEDGIKAPTSYQWSGFSKANKTGTLEVEDYVSTGNIVSLVWLYFGINAGDETDGSGTFTPVSPLDGYVEQALPGLRQVLFAPERPGSDIPLSEFSKISAEQMFVWVDVTDEIPSSSEAIQGTSDLGELFSVVFTVSTGGVPQGSMIDETLHRIVYTQGGRTWVKLFVQAGSDGSDFVGDMSFTYYTGSRDGAGDSLFAVSNQRFLIKVRDPVEV